MSDMHYGIDFDALADWAESDAPFQAPAGGRALAGEQARAASATVLAAAGRPTLGHTHARRTGRSPRRQVRLASDTSERLDRYAAAHGGNASAIIRDAVEEYLDRADA